MGALSWLAGNILWARGWEIPNVVLWWAAFLVLTIAGERLELTRLLPMARVARAAFLLPVALLLVGLVALKWPLIGVSLVFFAVWLMRFDMVRRTIHHDGLARFSAASLLTGYVWLAVAGILAILFGPQTYGVHYDAILHALFLGFVFSMIFAHAPIIFPTVVRVAIPYRPIFYAPLALLHLSLTLRVAGDLWHWAAGRMWGGALNVAAIAIFMATMVLVAVRARVRRDEIGSRVPVHGNRVPRRHSGSYRG
jgi:hypothetical protein